ncbi:T9SS type A sorting domain-containing protein [Emticicia sp. W12TSBA100-4]|uniref:T9SS type A sorting domain-containing protein n=1 Tax=Emticicia sp. W12TSBA100-4 TaxID=3160965 RepID=UPI003305E90B
MRFILTIIVALIFQQMSFSQDSMPAVPVVCYLSEQNSFTEIPAQEFISASSRLAATSNIEVTYIDFPEQAKVPFEQAIVIWERYLISTQTIRIKATWSKTMSNSVLAETGATRIYRSSTSTPNLPYANVWYPTPLAEALSGKELNSGDFDMTVTLNGNINWYLGTDAKAQSGRYDMITVMLHEIAHGLGFSSSMSIINSDTQGQYGQSGSAYIFDIFMLDSQKVKLTNTGVYGNPSTGLKTSLTSNALYFGLKNPAFANTLPRLYAPSPFKSGSSFSHFDESTYTVGTPNSLMSPSVRAAEVNHNPGELLLNCLNEMGWQINGLNGYVVTNIENIPEQTFDVLVFPNPVEDIVNIAFPLQTQLRTIKIDLLDNQGKNLQSIEKQGVTVETVSIDIRTLHAGMYFLRILDGQKLSVKKIVK